MISGVASACNVRRLLSDLILLSLCGSTGASCDAGSYCNVGGLGCWAASTCTKCPAGYYCPGSGWVDAPKKPCGANNLYSHAGAASCSTCGQGHYTSGGGSTTRTSCNLITPSPTASPSRKPTASPSLAPSSALSNPGHLTIIERCHNSSSPAGSTLLGLGGTPPCVLLRTVAYLVLREICMARCNAIPCNAISRHWRL